MRNPGRVILHAAILLTGCSGTYMSPLVSYASAFEECKARVGRSEAGVKRPHLVDEGRGVRGLIVGSGGFVCVEAIVTVDGKVADPKVLMTDNKSFANAFLQSLDGWVFEPAQMEGIPVAARVVIPETWPVKWSGPMDLWWDHSRPVAATNTWP